MQDDKYFDLRCASADLDKIHPELRGSVTTGIAHVISQQELQSRIWNEADAGSTLKALEIRIT